MSIANVLGRFWINLNVGALYVDGICDNKSTYRTWPSRICKSCHVKNVVSDVVGINVIVVFQNGGEGAAVIAETAWMSSRWTRI